VDEELVKVLSSHGQVVPHFHLPLQSGSDEILRRMNRQYRRSDFLGLVETLAKSFDRPALTTDVIVGFPGEADEQFRHTLEVVGASRFIHIHAFPYSPRPGTAAARWGKDLVPGATVNERIRELNRLSREFDHEFRQSFVGNEVSVVVERGTVRDGERVLRHGRCERYFAVDFEGPDVHPGDVVRVRVDCVTPERTMGRVSQ
jgi:threonylcarbamoyladenosine tRNA methylthiotransferase MtaB